MVDASVIEKCKLKDKQAFMDMYHGTIPYTMSIVRHYIPEKEDQKDLVQEIYAHLFLNIMSYESRKGTFKFWLRRLVVNECLMHLRSRKQAMEKVTLSPDCSEKSNQVDYQVLSLDRGFLDKVLGQMPPRFREVLSLVVFEGHSHVEVAKILGITPETSRSQFLRAKKWLLKNTDLKKHF